MARLSHRVLSRRQRSTRRRRPVFIEGLEDRTLLFGPGGPGPVDGPPLPPVEECTLRAAIEQANKTPGHQVITFAGSGFAGDYVVNSEEDFSDNGVDPYNFPNDLICWTGGMIQPIVPQTIAPQSPLPAITDPAAVRSGIANHLPMVEVTGGAAGSANGFEISGQQASGSEISGLAINNFQLNGIHIAGADDNEIYGNFIGTNKSGTSAAANGLNGVLVEGDGTWFGAGHFNVISGNTLNGIQIASGEDNAVTVNYIGTDRWGDYAIPNGIDGVDVAPGAGMNYVGGGADLVVCHINIGGPQDPCTNVISGNTGEGVHISGTGPNGTIVSASQIGTSRDGDLALPNTLNGVLIDGTPNVVVGANTISGNTIHGVHVKGATHSLLYGNHIGLNRLGDAAIPNSPQKEGVLIDNASTNTEVRENVISGNTLQGVHVTGSGTDHAWIQGNKIGVDKTGESDIGNTKNGVLIDGGAKHGIIGVKIESTTWKGSGNQISGNDENGIKIDGVGSDNIRIAGNRIGTNSAESQKVPNELDGILLTGSTSKIFIGVNDLVSSPPPVVPPDEGNTIAGNKKNGIKIESGIQGDLDGTDVVVIAGNRIGIGVSNVALGNDENGIFNQGTEIQIGTDDDGVRDGEEGNQIGSNVKHGIELRGPGSDNLVAGNSIFKNGESGIWVHNSEDNQIGMAGAGNTITENSDHGIWIYTSTSTGNKVQANYIGTNAAGNVDLGNKKHGVFVSSFARNNWIGEGPTGVDTALANKIAYNEEDGVHVDSGTENTIRLNSIYKNDELGIDLAGGTEDSNGLTTHGVTDNDARAQDADTGPNKLQNFPMTLTVSEQCGAVQEHYLTLDSEPNHTFKVDLYSVLTLDESAYGEGRTYLDTIDVTTDADGFARVKVPEIDSGGGRVTATATDALGNTSEFSSGYLLSLQYSQTVNWMTPKEDDVGDLTCDNPTGKDAMGNADGTPDFKGGWRFFPGAADYAHRTDGRNRVVVRATLTPATADIPIYFRSFDVDDPSSNADIDSNGDDGEDNRGAATGTDADAPVQALATGYHGRLQRANGSWANAGEIVEVDTDAAGAAHVVLATSFAAGDNFRVAASIAENVLDALDDVDDVPTTGPALETAQGQANPASHPIDGFGGALTDQLSIWRRFHVENDFMDTAEGDHQGGAAAGPAVGVGGGMADVDTNIAIATADEYEDGILRVGGVNYPIVGNTSGLVGGDTVTVVGVPPGLVLGTALELFQDDYEGPGAPTVRENTEDDANIYDYLKESMVRADNRFADAYILPVHDSLDQFDSDAVAASQVTATTHLDTGDTETHTDPFRGQTPGGAARPTDYETQFWWVVYMSTAFDPEANSDGDPSSEGMIMGVQLGQASLVYLESTRDALTSFVNPNVGGMAEARARVGVHEIAHQFDAAHTASFHRANTLMDPDALAPTDAQFYFHAEDVAFLRERVNSPGTNPLQFDHDHHHADDHVHKHDGHEHEEHHEREFDHDQLTDHELQEIVDAAVQRWIQTGLNDDQVQLLQSTEVTVSNDLPYNFLGEAKWRQVLISPDAAGHGWFVDSTPFDDIEFGAGTEEPEAKEHVDLLTVVTHELGHILGMPDVSPDRGIETVMVDRLTAGTRRIAKASDHVLVELGRPQPVGRSLASPGSIFPTAKLDDTGELVSSEDRVVLSQPNADQVADATRSEIADIDVAFEQIALRSTPQGVALVSRLLDYVWWADFDDLDEDFS